MVTDITPAKYNREGGGGGGGGGGDVVLSLGMWMTVITVTPHICTHAYTCTCTCMHVHTHSYTCTHPGVLLSEFNSTPPPPLSPLLIFRWDGQIVGRGGGRIPPPHQLHCYGPAVFPSDVFGYSAQGLPGWCVLQWHALMHKKCT